MTSLLRHSHTIALCHYYLTLTLTQSRSVWEFHCWAPLWIPPSTAGRFIFKRAARHLRQTDRNIVEFGTPSRDYFGRSHWPSVDFYWLISLWSMIFYDPDSEISPKNGELSDLIWHQVSISRIVDKREVSVARSLDTSASKGLSWEGQK